MSTTPTNDGGPAFPGTKLNEEVLQLLRKTPVNYSAAEAARIASYCGGMSLRDYFAAKADVSIYAPADAFVKAHGRMPTIQELADYIAQIRLIEADAMLAARNQATQPNG